MGKNKECRLPELTMLLTIEGKKHYSLHEKVMAAFIDGFCNVNGDVTKLLIDLEESNKENSKVINIALGTLISNWNVEYGNMINLLTSADFEDIDIIGEETTCRVPNGNALMLIRSHKTDYSDKQVILSAYIDGFLSYSGDLTKLLLTLGRTDRETHKAVSCALAELRRNLDKEYDCLVEHLNNI